MKNIRHDLDSQWNDLNEKENSLRENFKHFDKVYTKQITFYVCIEHGFNNFSLYVKTKKKETEHQKKFKKC